MLQIEIMYIYIIYVKKKQKHNDISYYVQNLIQSDLHHFTQFGGGGGEFI